MYINELYLAISWLFAGYSGYFGYLKTQIAKK